MRKFTKEIAALLATAAVGASAGAATASSAEEVQTAGVMQAPDSLTEPEYPYEDTPTEGTYMETTTTTTALYETPTEGTYVGTEDLYDTPLEGEMIETTCDDEETYWAGVDIPETTTTNTEDTWFAGGTIPYTTTTTATDDETWFAGGLMAISYGDANADGKLSVADSVSILQYIGNNDKYALTEEQRDNADCYNPGDGLTSMDALTIQRVDAGILSEADLPVYPESDN
ncbi:MAG: dockerin type I repeat-containing protein [Ruminococcus sp.]|nr:dockerin type I repeat-containing protein [Ruminococcus sp.]